jgi:hypothetical protein
MSFHLKTLPFNTTLSRQIAKQHLSRFNNAYWIAERSFKHLRASYKDISIPAPGPGVHGAFANEPEWEAAADEYHAWMRQHIIVSAAALLEVYVKSASITALTAKPELIDKTFNGIDGFRFVKIHKSMPKYLEKQIDDVAHGFVDGQWTDRLRRMGRVFGQVPSGLTAMAPVLQSLQSKRNRIAHQFGNEDKIRRAPWDVFRVIQIGPKEINDGIIAVSNAIAMADNQIFGPVIGGHEILHEYHLWTKKQANFNKLYVSGRLALEFRIFLGKLYGSSPGTTYLKGMIAYYNSIK